MKRILLLMMILLMMPGVYAESEQEDLIVTCESPTWEIPVDEEGFIPAAGYVLITSPFENGWIPLPSEGESVYLIRQEYPDGTVLENLIHLTSEGVCIETSNCSNHDCVDMGVVTLGNRDDRILWNAIVCLPNQVMIELFTGDEAIRMIRSEMR